MRFSHRQKTGGRTATSQASTFWLTALELRRAFAMPCSHRNGAVKRNSGSANSPMKEPWLLTATKTMPYAKRCARAGASAASERNMAIVCATEEGVTSLTRPYACALHGFRWAEAVNGAKFDVPAEYCHPLRGLTSALCGGVAVRHEQPVGHHRHCIATGLLEGARCALQYA